MWHGELTKTIIKSRLIFKKPPPPDRFHTYTHIESKKTKTNPEENSKKKKKTCQQKLEKIKWLNYLLKKIK